MIVAAGLGRRLGAQVPKCFLTILDRPVFWWALRPFLASADVEGIALVVPAGWVDEARHWLEEDDAQGVMVVEGGAERPESVMAGLAVLQPSEREIVAIHDGARPLLTGDLLARCLVAAARHGAALAAAPSLDTLKEIDDGRVVKTLDRTRIWRAQTPQVFRAEVIMRAYQEARSSGCWATDDAALVERIGIQPVIVESDWTNLKITVAEDLVVAEALLREREG